MVLQETTKLKLSYYTDEDQNINTQETNWKKVDAYAGILFWGGAGEPPDSMLYDGAVVAKSTGVSYLCTDNGAGGFNKKVINYPWSYVGYTTVNANTAHNGTHTSGWDGFDATQSGGTAVAANDPGSHNGIRVPVKGIYVGKIQMRYDAIAAGVGIRAGRIQIDVQTPRDDSLTVLPGYAASVTFLDIPFQLLLNANALLRLVSFQNSGGVLAFWSAIYITLVRPVD